ncbi:hypothetical protein BpHYR1_006153 [Brachionus plicatilis]|uniref:Uncharacterized protein n=1 Tax=Brachionus plicatilis TaxID=10195 RepID=A0A3M7RAA5_BRAPC|nr:hypothetical protein BpHYR1_006153 [Brachionus plicatilis]
MNTIYDMVCFCFTDKTQKRIENFNCINFSKINYSLSIPKTFFSIRWNKSNLKTLFFFGKKRNLMLDIFTNNCVIKFQILTCLSIEFKLNNSIKIVKFTFHEFSCSSFQNYLDKAEIAPSIVEKIKLKKFSLSFNLNCKEKSKGIDSIVEIVNIISSQFLISSRFNSPELVSRLCRFPARLP